MDTLLGVEQEEMKKAKSPSSEATIAMKIVSIPSVPPRHLPKEADDSNNHNKEEAVQAEGERSGRRLRNLGRSGNGKGSRACW